MCTYYSSNLFRYLGPSPSIAPLFLKMSSQPNDSSNTHLNILSPVNLVSPPALPSYDNDNTKVIPSIGRECCRFTGVGDGIGRVWGLKNVQGALRRHPFRRGAPN